MSLQGRGNFDPGLLDRRVTLQQNTPTRDSVGGSIESWSEIATMWAGKNPKDGGRFYAAEMKHYETSLIYRIRHRPDVSAGCRLIHGDDVFEIVFAAEVGRGQYLDLLVRGVDQTPGGNRAYLDAGDGLTFLDAGDGTTLLDIGVAA